MVVVVVVAVRKLNLKFFPCATEARV